MTFTRALSLCLVLSSLALSACGGGGEEEGPEIDCAEAPAPKFSEMTAVWAKCTSCHASTLTGPARAAAPADINFDTYVAAKAQAAGAMHEVYEGAMPPAGSPALTADEEEQLYRWASCGTPQ